MTHALPNPDRIPALRNLGIVSILLESVVGTRAPALRASVIGLSKDAADGESVASGRNLLWYNAAVVYDTAVADLRRPIVLQQEGRPVAVIIAFEEYQRLRGWPWTRRRVARPDGRRWPTLLQDVHRRPSALEPKQIEAETSLARRSETVTL